MASVSSGLETMARQDARAREQATIELARYEVLAAERKETERALADARIADSLHLRETPNVKSALSKRAFTFTEIHNGLVDSSSSGSQHGALLSDVGVTQYARAP